MEAKTILRLIKDDITHLEEITDEFQLESLPLQDEVEVALVRANALLRELELLHRITNQQERRSKALKPPEEPKIGVSEQDYSEHEPFELSDKETIDEFREVSINTSPAVEHFAALVEPAESGDVAPITPIFNDEVADERFTAVDESAESNDGAQHELIVTEEEVAADNHKSLVAEGIANIETVIDSDIPDHKEEILAEEFNEVKKTLGEILGESHKLVNDILSPEKIETGYQITPINSIWDGIGINDRFLFIRELFANSSAKFEATIYALDKLATIQDAVNYLKMNFKWNKTEASQKFLVLVKRRFTK